MSELELHKALIKEIKDRANDKYYDTKLIANAVYWILEQMADSKDEPQDDAKRCITCKHNPWVSKACREYKGGICDNYEPQADCDGCQHYADKHTADVCYECKRSYTDCYVPQTERNE